MPRRRAVLATVWAVLTLAAGVWLLLGNLRTEFGPLVMFAVAASLGIGPARLIALWRRDREDPLLPRIAPLRISLIISGLITFGPVLASMAGWIPILPAAGCFLGGFILMSLAAATFSDGYQGVWLDSLIFYGRLAPPDDQWVLTRDENRRKAQGKADEK